MREAMARAEVGDDVLDGDPTVAGLQELAADWLGKPRALFVPSGTMANQVALGAWTRPGDEIVLESGAHIANFEGGAAGYLHGLQTRTLRGERGALEAEAVRAAVQPNSVHRPRTGLVCVEQTHMGSGGRIVPLSKLQAVHEVASSAGIPVHMDGARLANAVVASGVAAREWAACADSVSICLSKGLGAPVGSIVAGDADFAERALRVRKRLGGWMRQAGILAAAGCLALSENVERLAQDHALARELARRLDAFESLHAAPDEVETNLVMVRVEDPRFDAAALAASLEERGVRVLPLGPDVLRFVTHLDVGPADVERVAAALHELLG
jgi:threonine aldolase